MKLRNDFSQKTRNLFLDNDKCFVCEFIGWDALHHAVGRESSSPLNAIPVHNMRCHFEDAGRLSKLTGVLLRKTTLYLSDIGYKATRDDYDFYVRHKKHYDKFVRLSVIDDFFKDFTLSPA